MSKKKTQSTWRIISVLGIFLCNSQAKQNPARCLLRAGRSQHSDSSGRPTDQQTRASPGPLLAAGVAVWAAELICRSSEWLWLCPAGPRSGLGWPDTDSGWDCSGRGAQRQERRQEGRAWARLHIMWLCCVADLWVLGWLQWKQEGDSCPVARQDHSPALPFVCC